MIKLLIGGSPCTYWSIAQTNNRETKAEGIGWELFCNYLIAKEKFKPDLFLYENNKSAAPAIKDQISAELGVPLMYINSALVSAQNRQRFYAFNWSVEQPQDRRIMLSDILEHGIGLREKGYALTKSYANKGDGESSLLSEFLSENPHKQKSNYSATPIRVGTIESAVKNKSHDSQQYRVYSPFAKAVAICAHGGAAGGKTGLYAIPCDPQIKPQVKPIYEVRAGQIVINGRQYPINLPDGYYIIRKLTVTECCRLQTLPDDYCRAVSPTQAYKGLGNGWTAEVIIHILNSALRYVSRGEEIVCLSMYDGIGTGRYCLDKMGFTNVRYYAYEIDKYAMKVANSNFPDIIQCGDAFDVRHNGWEVGG